MADVRDLHSPGWTTNQQPTGQQGRPTPVRPGATRRFQAVLGARRSREIGPVGDQMGYQVQRPPFRLAAHAGSVPSEDEIEAAAPSPRWRLGPRETPVAPALIPAVLPRRPEQQADEDEDTGEAEKCGNNDELPHAGHLSRRRGSENGERRGASTWSVRRVAVTRALGGFTRRRMRRGSGGRLHVVANGVVARERERRSRA